MNTTVKISPAQVFPVANKIRAAKHISMKEAYAEAKAQLIAEAENAVKTAETVVETPTNVVETPANMNLHTELVEKMKNGNVSLYSSITRGRRLQLQVLLICQRFLQTVRFRVVRLQRMRILRYSMMFDMVYTVLIRRISW